MYLLEKLTPIERAVLILKEAFDFGYEQIADIFTLTNESCRQHFSRAKKKLTLEQTRFQPGSAKHEMLMRKFLQACLNNNPDELIELLRKDVVVYADGGGKAPAVVKPLRGRKEVIRLLVEGIKKSEPVTKVEILRVNGKSSAALYLTPGQDIPDALIAIDTDQDGKINSIYYIVNRSKLQHLSRQTKLEYLWLLDVVAMGNLFLVRSHFSWVYNFKNHTYHPKRKFALP